MENASIPNTLMELKTRRQQFQIQTSTLERRRKHAVCVRKAFKKYGSKNNPNIILNELNMTVPKGAIYGLLGASGCGKTTLLSCIVGRRHLDLGEIWVLGGRPGSKGSGVPGPRIGYMPQEIALYGEFSIRETFIYFGWSAGLTTDQVEKKLDFLIKLLQLPPPGHFVRNLSGGQQRRVSLAAAILADPELLILDEPTVGVDPILRQNIWDYLVQITKDGNKTVIITTHYIEETRQASIIGLMRNGKFLAEESPNKLLERHRLDTLEAVFLKLSKKQNTGLRRRSSILNSVTGLAPEDDIDQEMSGEFGDNLSICSRRRSTIIMDDSNVPELPPEEEGSSKFMLLNPIHIKTLLWKNCLWMWRNVGVMLFIIGLPVLQMILFCLTIGKDPVGLKLAVINNELNSSAQHCILTTGCDYSLLSCRYLDYLKKKDIEFISYDDEEQAMNALTKGFVWGALTFRSNYSDALMARIDNGRNVEDWDIEFSDVDIVMDMSNQQIGQLLRKTMFFSYQDFARDLTVACNYSEKLTSLPVNFQTPIYGPLEPNFTDFAAPGVILTIIFFLSIALTSGAMLLERNEGLLERSLVIGITGTEILVSQVIAQFVIMFGQSVMVLLVAFPVFKITCEGNIVWITLLTILTGFSGMCFGFFITCFCANERTATYMALGSFLPIVMLCGIIWPMEGMHSLLRYFSYCLPLTWSTESMRSMLAKGWSITEPDVYYGFISTCVWLSIFLGTSITFIKFKKT